MRAPRHAPGGSLLRGPTMQGSNPRSAGPTCCTALRTGNWGNNPRERGADGRHHSATWWWQEQPPRARGRRAALEPLGDELGATPASAGPTPVPTPSTSPPRSNPRERGADAKSAINAVIDLEQPPRARGRRPSGRAWDRSRRATPASAGPTACTSSTTASARSNPRECGADSAALRMNGVLAEQPPRARGRLHVRAGLAELGGATPASAGPTGWGRHWVRRHGSNPHERGADLAHELAEPEQPEQPPRARGRPGDTEGL